MALILGISAYYHDSAVALISDGRVVAAASEERYSRKKHDERFPIHALRESLMSIDADSSDIDYVAFYEKPLLKFDRLLETYLAYAPRGYRSFTKAMPSWLQTKLHIPHEIKKNLRSLSKEGRFNKKLLFCEHHESHAASAFFPSPFDEAAILTIDGVGEWSTTSWGFGEGNRISMQGDIHFPHSLGLLYSAITYFCGFRVNSGEYKLMGLAPYGEPKYADMLRDRVIDVFPDGSFRLNMEYFSYCHGLRMTSKRFSTLLGCKPRNPEDPMRQIDMDLAASVQAVTEDVVMLLAEYVRHASGKKNLCMAGGVALNCVANGRLVNDGPFEKIWIQPAAGDAGGALGAAWLTWHQLMGNPRQASDLDSQLGSLLGPEPDFPSELQRLNSEGAVTHSMTSEELDRRVASLLADGKVVGWVQGRMEYGPRALGSRSILGDPRSPEMQTKMNLKIKFRESFRPFAPAVLEENASECFEMPMVSSPYMLFTYPVQHSRRLKPSGANESGLRRVRELRSDLPAVTHLDYSARVQTVSKERHPRFHSVLKAFQDMTGCPTLINTSFNVRGEPIVATASDAFRCFMATQMDALAVENCLFLRDEQPEHLRSASAEYLTDLEPD